ncbi:putative leucine-rich repeat receptor-like protein kinase [Quercus suber]|uniref:Leucine-rich repeat receptor-like protein kinase n=1 Tax=Quercus suber TaxID=58331 RepID=A0AAW0JU35_QUESU
MAPSIFISILVVAWALCIFMHATNMVIALDFEAKVLQKSKWWSSYSNDTSIHRCEWRGIECNDGRSVTELNINWFYISSNLITGTIPKELWNLKDLFELDLRNNTFVGPIPSALGLLTNLSLLDLSSNEINGSIVSEIGMLKNLLVLKLEHNKLTGPIPSSLGHLTSLRKLCLNSNQINSSIPLEIGNMKNLGL